MPTMPKYTITPMKWFKILPCPNFFKMCFLPEHPLLLKSQEKP